uniref:Chemokine interleukin-8-like domain-containing protein n=1 Tax=Salarias fasciatus TaxID=181472 RepID=A0A672JDB7_SALFA
MDLKVLCVIVCFYALTLTYTEAGIPKCCVTTKTEIPEHVLRKVQRWKMQTNTGACNTAALILHVKGLRKPVCAHPKIMAILTRIRRKMKRSARGFKN